MKLKDIKKVEYRQDPEGNDLVDFLLHDGTKERVAIADVDAELESIENRGAALRRRRRVLMRLKQLIVDNDPVPERAAKLQASITEDE